MGSGGFRPGAGRPKKDINACLPEGFKLSEQEKMIFSQEEAADKVGMMRAYLYSEMPELMRIAVQKAKDPNDVDQGKLLGKFMDKVYADMHSISVKPEIQRPDFDNMSDDEIIQQQQKLLEAEWKKS